jgi:hypothetical protein
MRKEEDDVAAVISSKRSSVKGYKELPLYERNSQALGQIIGDTA